MRKNVLCAVRHGESTFNKLNLFAGWMDVGLTERGVEQARKAGRLIHDRLISFDVVFNSLLARSVQTQFYAQESMANHYLPVVKSWRLNERHYGALQGLSKSKMAEKFGEEQVLRWRRSYETLPPLLETSSQMYQQQEQLMKRFGFGNEESPRGESLELCARRMEPLWKNQLKKELLSGKNVLVFAHGNSLRALVKTIEGISAEDIVQLNIANAQPICYFFDDQLQSFTKEILQ